MHAEIACGIEFSCRTLYNPPWRASVSRHQVQCNIPIFEALLRKYTYLFLERCRKSDVKDILCLQQYIFQMENQRPNCWIR